MDVDDGDVGAAQGAADSAVELAFGRGDAGFAAPDQAADFPVIPARDDVEGAVADFAHGAITVVVENENDGVEPQRVRPWSTSVPVILKGSIANQHEDLPLGGRPCRPRCRRGRQIPPTIISRCDELRSAVPVPNANRRAEDGVPHIGDHAGVARRDEAKGWCTTSRMFSGSVNSDFLSGVGRRAAFGALYTQRLTIPRAPAGMRSPSR